MPQCGIKRPTAVVLVVPHHRVFLAVVAALIAALVYRYQYIVLRTEFLEIIPLIILAERPGESLSRRMQRINHMECSFLRMGMPLEIATYYPAEPPPVVFGVRSCVDTHKTASSLYIPFERGFLIMVKHISRGAQENHCRIVL